MQNLLKASTDLQTAVAEKKHLVERKLREETLNIDMFGVFLTGTAVSIFHGGRDRV
jgi:hypothetical protein